MWHEPAFVTLFSHILTTFLLNHTIVYVLNILKTVRVTKTKLIQFKNPFNFIVMFPDLLPHTDQFINFSHYEEIVKQSKQLHSN